MRAVIQRVHRASVAVASDVVGRIQTGLLVLVATEPADTDDDLRWLSSKIVRLRIFDDEQGVMNRSVLDVGGEILLVSQFTLYASTRKGNRPSYIRSTPPREAETIIDRFRASLESALGRPIQTGQFGAHMDVALENNGPVTIIIDSKLRE